MTDFQEFLLAAHVLGAVIWVGGSWTLLSIGLYLRGKSATSRVDYSRWSGAIATRLFAPASIVVIIAGPLLASDLDLDFGEAWIQIGFVGWFLSFLIGVFFYNREEKKREAIIDQQGVEADAVRASLDRVITVAAIDTAIVTLVVLDMVIKPFL
jgi:uncharacterized membrane protein